jgi:hypothetical protein
MPGRDLDVLVQWHYGDGIMQPIETLVGGYDFDDTGATSTQLITRQICQPGGAQKRFATQFKRRKTK